MKEEIIELAKQTLTKKINELERNISEVQNSANQESKSSMGDKYETGRAMAQNEVFMLQTQLASFSEELEKFRTINYNTTTDVTVAGSLVETSMGCFLLSAGVGKVLFNKTPIMCISLNSPLAQALLGKKQGETYTIHQKNHKVLKIN